MRFTRVLIIFLLALAFLQVAYFEPLLPERVASHFDAAGRADGWSSKTEFLVGQLVFCVGMALLFLGLTAWLPKVPTAWVNLPHRDYWLAPERRAATLETISRQMEWLAAATLALLLGVMQLTIRANLDIAPGLPGDAFWLLFGGYMAFVAIWLVLLLRQWYAPTPS